MSTKAVIVRIKGGLGNQMFQYAFGLAASAAVRAPLLVDVEAPGQDRGIFTWGLSAFGIDAALASKTDVEAVAGLQSASWARKARLHKLYLAPNYLPECSPSVARRRLQTAESVYLDGYWQSEDYFLDAVPEVRRVFDAGAREREANRNWLPVVADGNCVSVHVRRGDYLRLVNEATLGTLGVTYYDAALRYLSERFEGLTFLFFSDDLDWVRNHLPLSRYRVRFADESGRRGVLDDLQLMSMCRHKVVANSSFSWWAAWLGEAEGCVTIAPRPWFRLRGSGIVPQRWIRLPAR